MKVFLLSHYSDICCIQESKLSLVDPSIWRLVGGSRLSHFAYTLALGSAGGMIVGWNNNVVEGLIIHQGTFCLSIEFKNRANNFRWVCTTMYGPNARHLKLDFWQEIKNCKPETGVPWVICGDFNSIFSPTDKSSGSPNLEVIRQAQSLLRDLLLLKPPSFGKKFTWTNGQANPIWVKVDHYIVNHAWLNLFPKTIQNCLSRFGSDHVPIRLELGVHFPTPRIFRFEKTLCLVEHFP